MRTETAVRSGRVAYDRDLVGNVDHDRIDQDVVRLGQIDQRLAGLTLHIGGINHGEQAAPQPGPGNVEQHVEGVPGGGLIVFVIGDQPRQKSDDSTCVGAKWCAAKVDLPLPDTPTSTTSDSAGTAMSVIAASHPCEDRHLSR